MRLFIGQILRPHGIRGEVLVDVRTDAPDERFAVGSVLTTDPTAVRRLPAGRTGRVFAPHLVPETLTIAVARPHLGRFIVLFDGIADREAADTLRGVLLCIDRAEITSSDDPEEFNDVELVGLTAVDAAGQRLGEVVRVDHPPASDLLVVRLPDGRDALVPFVRAIVPEVDIPGGRVVLTPPGGLFDL
jgi:16S rRNA processing protein RimM